MRLQSGANGWLGWPRVEVPSWYQQQESNLYLALRRRSFYPLNYAGVRQIVGGAQGAQCPAQAVCGPGHQDRQDLMHAEAAKGCGSGAAQVHFLGRLNQLASMNRPKTTNMMMRM